jgi:hypothetical protein
MKRSTWYRIEFLIITSFIVGIGFFTVPKFIRTQTINTFEHFPDPIFRRSVEKYLDLQEGEQFSRFDVNRGNDVFQEVGWFKTIFYQEKYRNKPSVKGEWKDNVIQSTKGIEFLTQIEVLTLKNHAFTTIDLSKNAKLRFLECVDTNLESLDLRNQLVLHELYCNKNKLQSLVFPQRSELRHVDASRNQLTDIDLNTLKELNILKVDHNELKELDLSSNQNLVELSAISNQIQTFILDENPQLKSISLYDNKIESLEIQNLPQLEELNLAKNPIQSFRITNVPRLKTLHVHSRVFVNNELLNNLPAVEELHVEFSHIKDRNSTIAIQLQKEFRNAYTYTYGLSDSLGLGMHLGTRIRSGFNQETRELGQ